MTFVALPTERRRRPGAPTLATRLDAALTEGSCALEALGELRPVDRRDALLTLLRVHDLHLGDRDRLGGVERWQHHPAIAALKWRLEERLLAELGAADAERDVALPEVECSGDAVAAMRILGRLDLVPEVYAWVADDAAYDDLVDFLALEGGPDGGFDDLVALCQVGLSGEPKLEMANNYWDEMGNGELSAVHTELHHDLARAIDMPVVPREQQPVEALERSALSSVLATNRHLQAEMVGALGLLELQAGPRCRKVVQGLKRVGAPAGAFPFYVEHATVDPRHGKDWVDKVVGPLAEDRGWAEGIVRGARWRSLVNDRFFAAMADRFLDRPVEQRWAS